MFKSSKEFGTELGINTMIKLKTLLFEDQTMNDANDMSGQLSVEEFVEDLQTKLGTQIALEDDRDNDDIGNYFELYSWISFPDYPDVKEILFSKENRKNYIIGDNVDTQEGIEITLNPEGVKKAAEFLVRFLKANNARKDIRSEDYQKKLLSALSEVFPMFESEISSGHNSDYIREYRFSFINQQTDMVYDGVLRIIFGSGAVVVHIRGFTEKDPHGKILSKNYNLFDFDLDTQKFAATVKSDFEKSLRA
jgi:hypothetical protein